MRYNTMNPVDPDGSSDPRDLYDNAANLDIAVNGDAPSWTDRLGKERKSWAGIEQDSYAFLANSGFELPPLEYVDGVPLTVDRPTQLIERDGNLYGVKLPASFPVSLTGTWATDEGVLVSRVDAALRQDLADSVDSNKGSLMLGRGVVSVGSISELQGLTGRSDLRYLVKGYYQGSAAGGGEFAWSSTTPRSSHNGGSVISPTVPWSGSQADIAGFLSGTGETNPGGNGCWVKIARSMSPHDFGAIGDDSADDYAAVRSTLLSGMHITWGNCTYRFATPIIESISNRISWISDGATLRYDGSDVESCLKITLSGAMSHALTGQITLNANNKSHTGWRIESPESGAAASSPSIAMTGVSARNVRRHTLELSHGDGILIMGGFHRIYMLRPDVRTVRVAAGAEIPSMYGAFGITVTRSASGETKYLDIVDPYVEDIQAEDPTNRLDQDGIRIFSSITSATEAVHNVYGGVVKNARNRSVKHQGMNGSVVGLRILKQASVVDPGGYGVAPSDWDVEAQNSGITIRDICFRYEGFGSRGVARWVGNNVSGRSAANGVISGIRGEIINTSIFGIASVTDLSGNSISASISDVNVLGPSDYIIQHIATGGGTPTISISNVAAQPTVAGVQEVGVPLGYILASNVTNTGGGSVPLMNATSSGNDRRLSAVNCVGFVDSPSVSSASNLVANAGAIQVAPSGAGDGGGIALVSCGFDRAATCLLAFDSSGATILQQTATRFVAGGTTEPGTGDFRVYVSGGKLTVRNRFGSSRRITIQLIG